MKRVTVILLALMVALLLAGLCSCKQEVPPEPTINPGVSGVDIPKWDKSKKGLQNLPDAVLSGTKTGVSDALVNGLKNHPELSKAKNLIVLVCEGLTSELIESSTSEYGELILNSFPVKGTTVSKFSTGEGESAKNIAHLCFYDLYQTQIGVVSWGDLATNSLRRMTTYDGNDAPAKDVYTDQFARPDGFTCVLGLGDFDECYQIDTTNLIYKNATKPVWNFKDAVPLYKTITHFEMDDEHKKDVYVNRLYSVFKEDDLLPSFRQEVGFALTWCQWKGLEMEDGFALLASYSVDGALDENDVQNFDEGVAVAVKYVLENPNTALIVCGCPVDGSEADVCFYGLGKDVSVQKTLYECVNTLK